MTILEKVPLKNSGKDKYTSFIFINGYYYCLIPTLNSVIKYDYFFNAYKAYNLEEKYKFIAYNRGSNLLYLVKESDYSNIYIADLEFNEIGLIELNVPVKYKQLMKSICYCNKKKRIYITTNNYVYSVTEDGYYIKEEYNISKLGFTSTTKMIKELNGCCYPMQVRSSIPNTYFTCCYSFSNYLYIGYIKNSVARLAKISLKGDVIEDKYVEDNTEINSIVVAYDRVSLFVLNNKVYNYMYMTDLKIDIRRKRCRKSKKKIYSDNNFLQNNLEFNENEILEAIALMEVSMSSILNSEGNKVQRAVDKTSDISELLKVNDSVNKTIKNIIILEQLLLEKLERASKGNNQLY